MKIVCWQTISMKYHSLFLSKIRKDVAKFVVCYSRDWLFKGSKLDFCDIAVFNFTPLTLN